MKYCVKENCDGLFLIGMDDVPFAEYAAQYMNGSYNVLAARILGFTYPDYLRYVRQNFNGELRGKEGYSYCIFKNKKDAMKLALKLNKEWEKIEKVIKEEIENGNG